MVACWLMVQVWTFWSGMSSILLRYLASLYLDKCFQREEGKRSPFFLAPNYQMTELQGAVALAQLERLPEIVQARNRLGTRLSGLLAEIPGIAPQAVPAGSKHSYFLYLFKLELEKLGCTARESHSGPAARSIVPETLRALGSPGGNSGTGYEFRKGGEIRASPRIAGAASERDGEVSGE